MATGEVPSAVVEALLTGVDDIDWNAVSHAYGPAVEVPALLRVWLSNDQRVPSSVDYLGLNISTEAGQTMSECASANLWGSVFHQGSVYEATEPVARLMQTVLVDAPIEEHRYRAGHLLLTCLARYAAGWQAAAFSIALHDRPEVYAAAASGWQAYLELLDRAEPAAVREIVARMLPWLDEPAAVATVVFAYLAASPAEVQAEVEREVDSLLLLALGTVGQPSPELDALVRERFRASPDMAVPAAIALARLHLVDPETDDDIIATLEDAVHQTDQDFGSQPLHYGRSGSVAECAADALVSIDLHAHDDHGTDTARARAEETLDGLSAILSERTLHELRLVHRLEP